MTGYPTPREGLKKGINSLVDDLDNKKVTEELSTIETEKDIDSQDEANITVASMGGGGCTKCIEVRLSDPTDADWYEGRIWIITI